MRELDHQAYFLQPMNAQHRRYEALRAVFVQEQPLQEVAQRFGVRYGTIRNWVSEFRRWREAGQTPPFSPNQCVVARQSTRVPTTTIRKSK